MPQPDPELFTRFCNEIMAELLIEACEVDADLAAQIGADCLACGEAFAALPGDDQDVLIAPFVEESFDHEPSGASPDLLASVTVVVRNGLLEAAHHGGPVTSGIIGITKLAAAPLSHILAARRREPVPVVGPDPFAGLAERYPRAWACLRAVADGYGDGGRQPLRLPDAPVPELPAPDEVVATVWSGEDSRISLFSATDERFEQAMVDALQHAVSDGAVLYTSALSRYSRNSDKLHRILEYVLAHGGIILTTNYLLRPTDVWVRRDPFVKPDSRHPFAGLSDLRGLAGTHRKVAQAVAQDQEPASGG